MKIDSDRLRTIRKRKKLSRPDLERASGINMRTIQRLENEPDKSKSTREETVMRLAKALDVETDVLTGELPLPAPDEVADADPKQVGAKVPVRVRMSYDLIKRRYGVNTTDVITMAPLFFALLAEGSLAWRREKLREADEMTSHLWHLDGFWRGGMGTGMDDAIWHGIGREKDSICKADLFGERLREDPDSSLVDQWFFDSSEDNPFASYLRKLAADLDIPDAVVVDGGELDFRLEFRFPYYGVCDDELDKIANGSPIGRAALEMGFVRTSEIPQDLMAKDKDVERQKWLEERMLEKFNGMKEEDLADFLKKTAPILVSQKTKSMLEENESGTSKPETEKKGDDQ